MTDKWRLTANGILAAIDSHDRFDFVSVGEVNGIPVEAVYQDIFTEKYVRITIAETEYEDPPEEE